ncbi:Alpha/beta hydrolase family protein [Micromonospora mirobrigensis]|uniref:Alpha/beta hydrolase family protein n=2 Tax=Micromonospora mirobrigensis TaxID=262898 RepID=A0A1C4YS92_9ACTN|nr:Alpha/beta hydrolase family protein [Micromonospora mirobrigensis]
MAADVVALLAALGHRRAAVVGHDRGGYVAMRAALDHPDRAADDADLAAGRRIGCPTLFCWSERDDMVELYGDPAAIWRRWAPDLRTASIDSGHHMAEEAPGELAAVLADFLGDDRLSRPW